MNFEAQLDLNGKISHGKLSFVNRTLVFLSKDGLAQQTFDEYSTLANYVAKKKIVITSTLDSKIKITVFDPRFAAHLRKEMDIDVTSSIGHYLRKNESITYVMVFLGIMFFGILISFVTKLSSGYIIQFISFDLENSIGKKAFSSSFSTKVVNLNPEAEALWQKMISKIMSSKHEIPHKVVYYIVKDETPNAFALPGGIIIINTGLIAKAESAEEVLGVLAHELGHVKNRDSINSMVHLYGSKLVLGILFGGSNLSGYTSDLANLKNSRDQETRADKYALKILDSANISSLGFATFFEKLNAGDFGVNLSWLSTHPLSKNRAAMAKAAAKSSHAKFDFPWIEFQKLVQN